MVNPRTRDGYEVTRYDETSRRETTSTTVDDDTPLSKIIMRYY